MAHTHPLLVLDVGGGTLRLGFASGVPRLERLGRAEPNCSGEAWPKRGGSTCLFGEKVQSLPQYQLHRPSRRGLLLDLQQQKKIWKDVLSRLDLQGRKLSDAAVLAVLAPLTPEVVVEEVVAALIDLGFAEASVVDSSCVALKSPGLSTLRVDTPSPCCTVLQLGFSACFAQPCVEGKAIASAGRRCPVGGRVLSNLLLESLKLRHYDLSHSWLVAQDILEKTCMVVRDAKQTQTSPKPVTYVLPDHKCVNGYVAETEEAAEGRQSVTLGFERLIPEALFRPQDFGIPSAGVAETVVQAIRAVREDSWRPFLCRLVLCGGLVYLPGLTKRLEAELKANLPSDWPLELLMEEEPEWSVWQGAVQHAQHADGLWGRAAAPEVGEELEDDDAEVEDEEEEEEEEEAEKDEESGKDAEDVVLVPPPVPMRARGKRPASELLKPVAPVAAPPLLKRKRPSASDASPAKKSGELENEENGKSLMNW